MILVQYSHAVSYDCPCCLHTIRNTQRKCTSDAHYRSSWLLEHGERGSQRTKKSMRDKASCNPRLASALTLLPARHGPNTMTYGATDMVARAHMCVCARICVHMHVCMYACVCSLVCACVSLSLSLSLSVCVCVRACVAGKGFRSRTPSTACSCATSCSTSSSPDATPRLACCRGRFTS